MTKAKQTEALQFCPKCGQSLAEGLLPTEDRPRLHCVACSFIFYQNPKVVAAALPERDGKVTLLRRGIPPREGTWTYPAGFVELGESVEAAAAREAKEETALEVEVADLLGVYSRAEIGIIVVAYFARVTGGAPATNREATEIAEFAPHEIPWEDLAFPSTEWALRDWVKRHGRR